MTDEEWEAVRLSAEKFYAAKTAFNSWNMSNMPTETRAIIESQLYGKRLAVEMVAAQEQMEDAIKKMEDAMKKMATK